jgi:hypothetical protein
MAATILVLASSIFCLYSFYAGVGFKIQGFIEALTKSLPGFFHFLVDLILQFGHVIFHKHIGTVTLLGVFVIDQRVAESIDMTGSLPGRRVHEDGRIDSYNVFMVLYHRFPPVFPDIVLQFNTILTVIINSAQSVVNFARRKYKTVFLGMGDDFLKRSSFLA